MADSNLNCQISSDLDELEAFADAIEQNITPIVSLANGTEALRIAMKIIADL